LIDKRKTYAEKEGEKCRGGKKSGPKKEIAKSFIGDIYGGGAFS